jgi:acyl-CoA synthetase (NDP forming)
VLLVNRRGAEVLGRRTHRTLAAAREQLGEPLDLVVVCVPAPDLVPAVGAALDAGARSLVVITAGFSERDPAGAAAEREAVGLARSAGAVLLGPNCIGLVDTGADLQLSHDLLPAGSVTVLSQSGNVVLDLAALLRDRGLGVARFVSLGNQADLTLVDLMRASLTHDGTRAVAVYAEDVVDGRAFVAAARALEAAGKPVVLLAPGRSAAAVRSAVSHTGSLTTAYGVVDAACAAAGAHRVDNPTQLADLLVGLLADRRMAGRRTAILTDGGGHGAIAGDALAVAGLESPRLAETTRTTLRGLLSQGSTVGNPVDLAGAGERDPLVYTRALATLLSADEVDGVLVTGYFGGYSTQPSALAALEHGAAEAMVEVVRGQRKPVAVHTIFPDGPTGLLLRAAGIPVHRDVDRAAAVLAGLVERPGAGQAGLALPPAAPPVTDTSYAGARALFAAAGVPFTAAVAVHGPAELEAAFEDGLAFPLVLKATGRQHKSDGGGVVLGLRDADQARAAYATMLAELDPPAVSVEPMVDTSRGVEVIVGCVRDPRFGPVLVVGVGGVFTEVLADTALAIAPVSAPDARRLLLALRAAPLLLGARGREPVDLDALADVVSRVSQVAAAHPELVEVELNPVLARAAGAVALDARVVLEEPGQSPATSRR